MLEALPHLAQTPALAKKTKSPALGEKAHAGTRQTQDSGASGFSSQGIHPAMIVAMRHLRD